MFSFFFMGLAVLAKGLVGAVLVSVIFGIYLVFAGQLRSVRWRDWLFGPLVFLAVAGTWYGPVIIRHGWAFIEEFFVRHHFQRYTSNEFGHPQPVYFFLLVALAGLATHSPSCFGRRPQQNPRPQTCPDPSHRRL